MSNSSNLIILLNIMYNWNKSGVIMVVYNTFKNVFQLIFKIKREGYSVLQH